MASFWYPSSWNFGVDPDGLLGSSSAQDASSTKPATSAPLVATEMFQTLAILLPHPVNQDPLGFGKYKGKTPLEIATFDPGYILWCAGKGITTGDEKLVAHCQQVIDRAGPAQLRGHLKYGPRR